MGWMEEHSRQRTRRKNIARFVLSAVAVAGVLSMAVVAPNAIGAMSKLGLVPNKRQKEIINRARDRLVREGYLERTDGHLRVTPKGKKYLARLDTPYRPQQKPKHWDGKWRVIIFDIPESQRQMCDKMRHALQAIGFRYLQNSVWIYPYDCEDVAVLLKHELRTGRRALYMIVEEIEGAVDLKKTFRLS